MQVNRQGVAFRFEFFFVLLGGVNIGFSQEFVAKIKEGDFFLRFDCGKQDSSFSKFHFCCFISLPNGEYSLCVDI